MTANDPVTLQISNTIVEPIVRAKINAMLIEELGKSETLIPKMVEAAMRTKVDSNGRVGNYSSENKYDFIEIACRQAIQEAAKEALKGWLEANRRVIVDAVEASMKRQSKSIAATLVESFGTHIKSGYSVNVTVQPRE